MSRCANGFFLKKFYNYHRHRQTDLYSYLSHLSYIASFFANRNSNQFSYIHISVLTLHVCLFLSMSCVSLYIWIFFLWKCGNLTKLRNATKRIFFSVINSSKSSNSNSNVNSKSNNKYKNNSMSICILPIYFSSTLLLLRMCTSKLKTEMTIYVRYEWLIWIWFISIYVVR